MTVSPLLTSAPGVRVQEVTVPLMGAVALKLARAFWASVSLVDVGVDGVGAQDQEGVAGVHVGVAQQVLREDGAL